jgi:hypothetical protein
MSKPKPNLPKLILVLVGLALLAAPVPLSAQQTRPKTSGSKSAPAQTNAAVSTTKQPVAGPFNGKLAAVDKTARSITVGKRTFQITPETKLRKANQPATLEDAIVGEKCSGYVKPTGDGKWIATTVNFGPKSDSKGAETKQSSTKAQKD